MAIGFGVGDGADPLPGEKQELRRELRAADAPGFGQGPIHFHQRNAARRDFCARDFSSAKRGAAASGRFFEKSERLVVAATVEVMREMRIDGQGELRLERRDSPGGGAEFFQMRSGIARVEIAVGDDGDALAERGGEFGEKGRVGHAGKVRDGWRVVHCDPGG